MKTSTVLILVGAAGAGAFFLLRKPNLANLAKATPRRRLTIASTLPVSGPLNGASQPKQAAPSVNGRDIVTGASAAGAAAGCTALGGAAVAPLCGMAGGYLGDKAYSYGKDAVNTIKGWF